MEKFEDIIKYGFWNKNTYNMLCRHLYKKGKDIVCYVGAGLSLYCTDWEDLIKKVYESIPDNVKIANGKEPKWEDYKGKNKDIDYLKMADEIDNMLRSEELKSNFNERVYEYLNYQIINYKSESSEKEWELPIEKKAVFYLPFLMSGIPQSHSVEGKPLPKGRILTTNLDDSIKKAFSRHGFPVVQLTDVKMAKVTKLDGDNCFVFHLHGYYLFQESYVLTGKDYRKIYNRNGENKKFLQRYAFNPNVVLIFLGAGLNNDVPLKILKKCLEDENEKRNFAFLSEEKSEIAKRYQDVLKDYDANSFFIPKCKFYCYAIVLCHMIREANVRYWDTFLCKSGDRHDLYTGKDAIKDVALENFLKDEEILKKIEHSFNTVLKQKLKNHLYIGQGPSYEWAVCWIDSEDFNFSQDKFSPLEYNLPLGNTIYMIYDVSYEKQKQYLKMLEKWCDDNKEIFDGGIKVRVIYQPRSEYLISRFEVLRKKYEGCQTILKEIVYTIDILNKPLYHKEDMFSICERALYILTEQIDELIKQIFNEVRNEKNKIEQAILKKNEEQSRAESQTQIVNENYQENVEVDKAKTRKLDNIHDSRQE